MKKGNKYLSIDIWEIKENRIKALAVVNRKTGKICLDKNGLYAIYNPNILKREFFTQTNCMIKDIVILIRGDK